MALKWRCEWAAAGRPGAPASAGRGGRPGHAPARRRRQSEPKQQTGQGAGFRDAGWDLLKIGVGQRNGTDPARRAAITGKKCPCRRSRTRGELDTVRIVRSLILDAEELQIAGVVEPGQGAGRIGEFVRVLDNQPGSGCALDRKQTNAGISVRDALHTPVGGHDDKISLLGLRAHPEVVFVDAELPSGRLVDPFLDVFGTVLA